MEKKQNEDAFCRAYLRTMDPERAAAESGCRNGFSMLRRRTVRERLERMREAAAGQLRREDVLRQLGQVMYDAHRGRAGGDESIPDLLARADELNEKIGGMKDRVSALRQSRTCGTCGAVCGREDKFCRSCGQPLE